MSNKESDALEHLQLWRTFLAVHATGSLSAAARTIGLTQPAVSSQLQTLERLVGERLFVRGARGVSPTSRADEIAARLARPFDDLAAALEGTHGPSIEPPVRLGGAAELLAEVVAPAVAPLIADGLRLRVQPGLPADLYDGLRSGSLDLVISSERPRGRALLASPLVDETFVLVASPEVALAVQGSAADLLEVSSAATAFPLLAYARDLPMLRRYWRHVFGIRLEVEPSLTFPDLRALRDAAIGGAGITVLPSYLCRKALADGSLVDLYLNDDPPINTLYLLHRPASAGRSNVMQVVNVLTGTVATAEAD